MNVKLVLDFVVLNMNSSRLIAIKNLEWIWTHYFTVH